MINMNIINILFYEFKPVLHYGLKVLISESDTL